MISTNDKIPYNNRRTAGVFRSVAMVLAIFVVSLVTLGILAYSGVNVPFFSNALNGSINGAGSGTSGGSSGGSSGGTGGGSGGGSMGNGSGGGSGSGIGGGAGGSTGSGSGSGSVDGSGSGSGSGSGWVGGAPSELMGSGGAWDGSEIRIPAMSLSYDSGEETEFCLYGNYLAECSRDSFSLLDSEGAEVFRKNIDFTKPALHKRGDYLLVSDIGGRSAFVMKGAKLVWEESFSSGIVNASINKNGYIAFVFDAVGYRNSVKIMAPMGKTLFDWVVADDYVLSSEIAPSGKELVINRLKTTGIGVSSGLEFFDINAEPIFTIDSDEGEVFLGVRYLDGGMMAVASEDVFRLYSEHGELIIQEKYESIMAMCEFPRGKAAVAVRYNNRALVMEYDGDTPKGRVLYISEKPIVNMSADNGYLFINLGHEVVAIKDNGSIVSRLTLDSETLYGGASEKFGILAVTKKSADIFPF
ncbi:MAG: DUF5711 family protein [Oscillospiraceae bacterium]|nr:DUF5711 family protein [Oscillospiraceae bacterium]